MPRTLTLMHVGAIAKLALLALAVLVLPVTAIAVLGHVPGPALAVGLWWPAMQGILPTVTFLVLPGAVGVAVALYYASLASEGQLAASYALRLSPVALAGPALIVGLAGSLLGFAVAGWIAPSNASKIHDTIFTIEHKNEPRLLEPRRLYELGGGRYLFRFEGWIDRDTVSRAYLLINEPGGERRVLFAERATFVRGDETLSAVFEQGYVHTYQPGQSQPNSIGFDRFRQSFGTDAEGALPRRPWRGVFELSPVELYDLAASVGLFGQRARDWVSEAFKRLAIPFLAFAHAIFAVGLVMRHGRISTRREFRPAFWVGPVALVHAVFVVFGEMVIFAVPAAVWLALALILLEIAIGARWLMLSQHGPGKVTRSGPSAPAGALAAPR
jgi:lipopolysaccharide export system permease protein